MTIFAPVMKEEIDDIVWAPMGAEPPKCITRVSTSSSSDVVHVPHRFALSSSSSTSSHKQRGPSNASNKKYGVIIKKKRRAHASAILSDGECEADIHKTINLTDM
eukprot:GHVH01011676.1.p1 GENE.GHVH01011676.1~~GHVH01011676.1.p1  ORF type:complete len:105 (+),score=16.62 GHVH01011676.1:246-560(+)